MISGNAAFRRASNASGNEFGARWNILPQLRASVETDWESWPDLMVAGVHVSGGEVEDLAMERRWVHSRGVRKLDITYA